MIDTPTQPPIALPHAHPRIERTFISVLLLSVLAACFPDGWCYFVSLERVLTDESFGIFIEWIIEATQMCGSAVALALAVVMAIRFARQRPKRSRKYLALTLIAACGAVPMLFFLYGTVYSLLPPTESELHSIAVAEEFVRRNGYTAEGHPKDLPVLQTDILDRVAPSADSLLEMRKDTLKAKAVGIRYGVYRFPGDNVYFEYTDERIRSVQIVQVSGDHAQMVHAGFFPGMHYKRLQR